MNRFHPYLYGRKFTIYSDHRPLQFILNPSKQVPPMASSRIQRWAITLCGYQYPLRHRPGELFGNADALSRLPVPETPTSVPVPGDLLHLNTQLDESIITATTSVATIYDIAIYCNILVYNNDTILTTTLSINCDWQLLHNYCTTLQFIERGFVFSKIWPPT